MQRAQTLVALNRRMLEALSRRTTDALGATLALRIVLPYLNRFLALNVAKEVSKDALVIRRASEELAAGALPAPAVALELLAASKEIDRQFLAHVRGLPVRIEIPYERIGPLRLQRIERTLDASYRILAAWQYQASLRAAVGAVFSRQEFERHLLVVLDLYARETQALSFSVWLPVLLAPVREGVALGLQSLMTGVSRALVRDVSGAIYRRRASWSQRICGGR